MSKCDNDLTAAMTLLGRIEMYLELRTAAAPGDYAAKKVLKEVSTFFDSFRNVVISDDTENAKKGIQTR